MADGYFDRMLGDDAGVGTIGDPWRTIAKYEAQSWAAGDVAYFMRGQRWQDTPTVPTSGSNPEEYNVFISAYGDESDPLPIFSGANLCGGWIHRAEVGPEILTDPSFEAWTTSTNLTNYTEAVAGGTINQEATEVMDGDSAVEMIRTSAGYFGIYQEPHTLAWDTSYIFSCHHMETDANVLPGVMISRGPVGSGAKYLQTNGSWAASPMQVHYFTQTIDVYSWFDIEFDTGADDATGWDDEYRIEWTSFNAPAGYTLPFYLDKASLRELILPENQLQNHEWENWTGTYPTETPDIWNVTENGTSEVTKESTEVFKGSYSCKIHIDGSNSDAGVDQDLKEDLPWNTKFRISVWHKEALGATATGAGLQVAIGRGLPTGQYLQADGTWDSPVVLHALCTDQYNPDWTEHHLDFDTGASGHPSDYNLQITPYSVATIGINSDHYIGPVRIGRIKQYTPNLLPDPGLDSWPDGVINNYNWTPIETVNTRVTLSKQAWYGKTAADLYTWDDDDVGIKAEGITFEPSTEYRLQTLHQEYVQDGYADVEIALRVQRHMASAPDQYWDPSTGTWEETILEAWTGTAWDWGLGFVNFTTPSGALDQTYTLWIHRNSGTCPKRFHIQIDEPAVVKVVAEEVYVCDFEWLESTPANYDSPIHCYVTGSLRGVPVDSFQLMKEDPFTAHPRLWCWSYDAARRLCYLNIGEDPGDLEVELSVRDYNFEFNQQSHVTLQYVNLEKAVRANADLPHAATSGARKEDLTVEHCKIRFAGEAAVKAGYQPVNPAWGYSGANPDSEVGYCPADLIFRDNEISYWNRNRNTHIKKDGISWDASWGPFDCGILVAYGKDADESRGDEIGTVLIQRNRLESDRFLFNGNSGINGVYIMLGDDVTIEDNYLTGTDHALIASGSYLAPGDARTVTVRRNFTWETGDDGCWLYGLTLQPRVCFNLFGRSGDNGVDCWDSVGAEIYQNTFYENRNENVVISASPSSYCSAFVYNNIFAHWGEWVKEAGSVNQRGCAVGFAGGYTLGRTFIDHNLLFPDPDIADAGDHTYHFDEAVKTIAEARGYGYELNSLYGSDPRFRDPDNGDLRLRHDSPAIDGGKDLREIPGARWYDSVTYTWTRFRSLDAEIEKGMLDPDSDWPTGIQTVDPTGLGEAGAFDQGAFGYITHKSTYYVTDSGAGIENLLPVVNEWRTVGGREISPVPVLYEIGGGGYAFACRPVRTMWAKVDADPTDSLTLGDLRYRTFEIKPDEGYLQRMSEQIPDGLVQETVNDELSEDHGAGAWDPEFTSYWSEDMVATARIILGIPAVGTTPATPSAGALFGLAASLTNQDGVIATIRAQTDQFTFTGADVNSTLAGEEVDIGSVKGTPVASISDFVADLTALTSLVQGCATPSDILVNSTQPIFTDSSGYVQLANAGLGGAINTATIAIQAQTDLMAFVTGDIKATLDGETVTAASVTDKTGYSLADGSFKAVTFDGSTAYPIEHPDSGASFLARAGPMAWTNTHIYDLVSGVGAVVQQTNDIADIIALMYEYSVDHYRWKAGSLELGPTSGDWTANEKTAVMAVLGVLTDTAVPVEPTSGTLKTIKDDVAGVATLCGDIAGIKTDVTSILTNTAEIAAVKTQTDKISVNVIPNQSSILGDLVDIDADVTIVKNKINLFPDDLASDAELQGYLTALQGNITTPLALVQTDTTALLADTLLLKGLTFHNTHRRARTYAGGLLIQEYWDEYDGGDFGPGSGSTALVINTWKVDYVYQGSTDKVQDMYVRPG